MNKQRIKKLESLSREIIWSLILEEINDDENDFWLINVSEVVISSDLSYLDVWVSCFKNEDKLAKTIAKHNNVIQNKYNKKISIRKLPRIRYRYDNKWAIWQDVCNTINKLSK